MIIIENKDFLEEYEDINLSIYLDEKQIGNIIVRPYFDNVDEAYDTGFSSLELYIDEQSEENFPFKDFNILNNIQYGKNFPVSNFLIVDVLELRPEYRGKGYGDIILKELSTICKNKGIEYILLTPSPIISNEEKPSEILQEKILNFYLRNNFKKIYNSSLKEEYTGSFKHPYCYLKIS